PIHQLIGRVLAVQNPCQEASFWQGLCHLRDGKTEQALASLQTARAGQGGVSLAEDVLPAARPAQAPAPPVPARATLIDPPLYIGAVLLGQGRAKEALRFLTEANRLDGNCPFVTCQLGAAMLAAGGDAQLAIRALQRVLGPRGLLQWQGQPNRAWVEGFPEH